MIEINIIITTRTKELDYIHLKALNTVLTLNLLSCSTFLIATVSPVSHNLALYTTPKLPLPITIVSVYDTSNGRSGP